MSVLRSPTTGLPLRPEGADTLTDGRERWPVLDGIPYLRTGRDALVTAVLADLDRGDRDSALVRFLSDQDDWWDGAAPPEADLRTIVRERERLTLRDAMRLLAYGRVGDYFAHRWSDPTYLAGLALLDAHWSAPRSAFELACGIGHYLRDLAREGVRVTGADVVFSKLWLARHWVVGPAAELLCFDARSPWPIAEARVDLCLCQDAFYFLEPKAEILRSLRAMSTGRLAIGHIHNRDAANLSAGHGVSADEIAKFFPRAVVYDDDELTRAARDGRVPVPAAPDTLRDVEAFALVEGHAGPTRAAAGPLLRAHHDGRIRRNPLYGGEGAGTEPTVGAEIAWPSERYRAEYAPRATYRTRTALPARPSPGEWSSEQMRRREVVDLPERW